MFASQFIAFTVALTCCHALSPLWLRAEKEILIREVLKFQTENGTQLYDHGLFQYIRDNFKSTGTPVDIKSVANSFSWTSCGTSSDLLVVNGLSVSPDPIRAPGTVGLNFDVTIQDTFSALLKLAVVLKKYERFFWLTIPCIDNVGSCTYDDICQRFAGFVCPKPFVEKKIPCKCPFIKGSYSLPTTTFSLPLKAPSGQYHAQATLSYGSKPVNCINIYFNIA